MLKLLHRRRRKKNLEDFEIFLKQSHTADWKKKQKNKQNCLDINQHVSLFFSLNEQQEDPNSFPSSSSNWSERPRRAGGQHESDFAAVSSVCRSASLRPDHDPTCPTHVGGRRRPGSVRYASPDIPCVTSSVRPNFFFFFSLLLQLVCVRWFCVCHGKRSASMGALQKASVHPGKLEGKSLLTEEREREKKKSKWECSLRLCRLCSPGDSI